MMDNAQCAKNDEGQMMKLNRGKRMLGTEGMMVTSCGFFKCFEGRGWGGRMGDAMWGCGGERRDRKKDWKVIWYDLK